MQYKDLDVYNKSYDLALSIYKFSETLPNDERYGMISQLKRASLSVPMNIAEGYGKQSTSSELIRFLQMAKGSCNEMQVLIELCRDLGYVSSIWHSEMIEGYDEIAKMINGLMKKL